MEAEIAAYDNMLELAYGKDAAAIDPDSLADMTGHVVRIRRAGIDHGTKYRISGKRI